MNKPILDPASGSRMFWFDKDNQLAVFGDIRKEEHELKDGAKMRHLSIDPDVVMDFRDMPFADGSYKLVIFDPPHMTSLGKTSWMARKYGRLNDTWQDDIKKGFSECFRVLEDYGVLVFKWNEYDIPVREILKLTEYKPLVGHRSGKQQKTHWLVFMKTEK